MVSVKKNNIPVEYEAVYSAVIYVKDIRTDWCVFLQFTDLRNKRMEKTSRMQTGMDGGVF
jgi:hypothetical protein